MIKWIKDLISSASEQSHKRFIAVGSWVFMLLVIIAYIVLVALKKDTDNTILYILASLIGGESVATVIDKVIAKPSDPAPDTTVIEAPKATITSTTKIEN